MFVINKAHVAFISKGKYITYVRANIQDQELETLQVLGRGRMYEGISTAALKYILPGGLIVFLRTD